MYVIIIIEDDNVISNQIEKAIYGIDREIKILKARDGMNALKITKMMEVNIFIIDIGLPDCDGIELAKEIRKTYPYQPIIIESSKGDAQYQMHVHDQIENLAFLSKPYSNEKLIAKVNHALTIVENIGTNQLKINQNGFLKIIEIRDIIYIEKVKNKKKIVFVSYNQDSQCIIREEFVGLSLSSILDMLTDRRDLFRCHKGFIINPKMIDRLNYANNTISMKHVQEEIPIGKTFKSGIDLLL